MRGNSDIDADGASHLWPSPIRARRWEDPDGTTWRLRGRRLLSEREMQRLLKRPAVRVLHVYGVEPRLVTGAERQALLDHVDLFFRGRAAPMTDFRLGEFRNQDHEVMLVVEESC